MAIEIFNVSFTLSRDTSNDDDDETWVDEEHIASEIRSWLEDIDYGVTDININNTKFIRVDWSNTDVNAVSDEEYGDISSIKVDEAMKEWRKNVQQNKKS